MNLKILEQLPLSPTERKTFIKVAIISTIACAGLGVSLWGFQTIRSSASAHIKKIPTGKLLNVGQKTVLPIDIEAHRFVAEYYGRNDQPLKAIEHLERLVEVGTEKRPILCALATACLEAGEYAAALEHFEALTAEKNGPIDSLTPLIHARLGLSLFNCGRVAESFGVLDSCIAGYPLSTEAYCYRGLMYAEQDPASLQAEADLKKSIEIAPSNTDALYQLARYYMNKPDAQKAEYQLARELLQKVLEITPLDPKVHSRIGMVYYYLQQPDLAEKSYKLALALNPDDYNTHYNLGEIYFSAMHNEIKALEEFHHTVQLKPDHIAANFRIGIIALKNNDANQAIRSFEAARRQAPENIRVLLQLALAYEQKKLPVKAEEIYREIIGIDELNQIARQKLDYMAEK
jgi:tetratricopeptide (TPR) repeat protein